jgi:hypothetical protein
MCVVAEDKRHTIADQARGGADKLEACLKKALESCNAESVRCLLDRLEAEAREKLTAYSWDEAEQLYLAMRALDQAMREMDCSYTSPGRSAFLETLACHLGFPCGDESPSTYDAGVLIKSLKSRSK